MELVVCGRLYSNTFFFVSFSIPFIPKSYTAMAVPSAPSPEILHITAIRTGIACSKCTVGVCVCVCVCVYVCVCVCVCVCVSV